MYVFVGLLYSECRRKQIINQVKTSLESAANTYQWELLKGLRKNTKENLVIINSVPMGTFPRQSKILNEKDSREEEFGIYIDNIGYLNLPIIKQKQRSRGLYKRLCKIARETEESITVILYSLYNPFLKSLYKFKKNYSNVQYLIIVPDLPCEYGIESENKIKRWINRKIGYQSLAFAEKADGYIFLTEQMNNVVNKKSRPYRIIEGIGKENNELCETHYSEKPIILYTGTLNRILGIDILLNAYLQLETGTVELWIAGNGDMREEIERLSKENEGVKYFGYCSKEEVFEMQSRAWILVNPRSGKDAYTQYSFPSKTLEYLSMGKPVAMNCLPGMPQEYSEHIFFFQEDTAESMAKTFKQIIQLSPKELNERKKKQLEFVKMQKSGIAQTRKILQLKEEFFKD